MKQKILTLSLLFILIITQIWGAPSAITFNIIPGSRFGDQLILYIKAKWIAYQHKMPFYCLPISFCEHLVLGQRESITTLESLKKQFRAFAYISGAHSGKELLLAKDTGTLYIIDLMFQPRGWETITDLEKITDSVFISEIREMCKPIEGLSLVVTPKNMMSVALHVRKGGGYDRPLAQDQTMINRNKRYADQLWPLKFPPDSFYIEQLKVVHELVGRQPLYVYLFTDDQNPRVIAEKYSKELDNADILFDYRDSGNAHDKHVLEDFFAMTQFDVIIRGDSSYSTAAQFLGNPSIVMCPTPSTDKRR